ncbi:MAG: polysaccharide biosynthesis protein [Balneolales bacterium]|nr:polysaccharide biosynthesis protein [Balneolales bacterium]
MLKKVQSQIKPDSFLYSFFASARKRYTIKILLDFSVLLICAPLAVLVRLGHVDALETSLLLIYPIMSFAPKLLGLRLFNVHRQSWHNVSVRDLNKIILAIGTATLLTLLVTVAIRGFYPIPFGILVIDAMLSVLLLGFFRLFARVGSEQTVVMMQNAKNPKEKNKRVLIIGAGSAGTMMARELMRHPETKMQPVAFLDDDPGKHKQRFLDLPVLGSIDDLEEAVKISKANMVLTAIPSNPEAIREVVEKTSKLKINHQILPRLSDLINGKVSISQIRNVDVQDLLQRDAVELNMEEIARYISGKVVLVTGGGGSIGSEIIRQVCRFRPKHLIVIGRGENSVYQLQQELHRYHSGTPYTPYICDVRDEVSLRRIFSTHHPQIVFHAAAHKHVPLMESNPEQAVLNNIFGTSNLVELSLEFDIERFVNISTDKAVNPTSVMGASKRVAEYVVESGAVRARDNRVFVSVRFGNVLGSRGSVIPLFKEQIKKGGPVTVTDEQMTRYFMTIPEASQLVLQAGGMDNNGAVYVLDMGEPVRIVDLARDLIKLSGFEPDVDIKIEFTGTRPGEKLYEEILTAEEGTLSSKYEKIFMARKKGVTIDNLDYMLQELRNAAESGNSSKIRECFYQIIPNYSGFEQETPA